ncbi:MAG: hypothetical protein ACLP9L_01855 [Thermoguttaceae bacterium]
MSDEDNMTTNLEEPRIPFGKYKGKPISDVLRQDRSYLTWFCDTVDGNQDIKRAIRALPGFSGASGKNRQPVSSSVDDCFCIDPRLSREDLDRLCWEILHPPKEK